MPVPIFANDWTAIAFVGAAILILGLFFLAACSPNTPEQTEDEATA